jgi:hypothetical protein
MSEHTTSDRCEAGDHRPCDGKVRKMVPIVTAMNTRVTRQIVGKCSCGCHWAPSYTTRGGIRVSW